MYKISLVFLFTAYLASAQQLTPCASGDSACLLGLGKRAVAFFAKGSPEMGIQPAEPMKIDRIESNNKGLELVFTDTAITGLKNCEVTKLKFNEAKNKQVLVLKCSVNLNGLYKLHGKLLILPVEGEGKYNIKIDGIEIKVNFDLDTFTGKDGKTHWHIKDWRHSYKGPNGTTFRFENLFNGDEASSKIAHDYANTNWKDVMTEFAPEIVAAIVSPIVNNIDTAYNAMPIEKFVI